jgi:hypothetical protein
MPIEIGWDNPHKTVFLITTSGSWTMEEYYEQYLKTQTEVESVPHSIVLISDMSQSYSLPPNFFSVGSFMRTHRIRNLLFTVMVTNSTFYNFAIRTMTSLIPKSRERMAIAQTLGEARQMARARLDNVT